MCPSGLPSFEFLHPTSVTQTTLRSRLSKSKSLWMDSATEKLWKDLEHHHASSMQMYLKRVEALDIFQVLLCGCKAWQNTYSISYNITLRYCDLPGWTVWNSTKSPSSHLESLHSVDSPSETGKVWAKCLNAKRLADEPQNPDQPAAATATSFHSHGWAWVLVTMMWQAFAWQIGAKKG